MIYDLLIRDGKEPRPGSVLLLSGLFVPLTIHATVATVLYSVLS